MIYPFSFHLQKKMQIVNQNSKHLLYEIWAAMREIDVELLALGKSNSNCKIKIEKIGSTYIFFLADNNDDMNSIESNIYILGIFIHSKYYILLYITIIKTKFYSI